MRILVLSRGGRQQTRTEDQRVNYIVCQNCWLQLNQVVRVGLVEEVTSEQRFEEGEAGSHARVWLFPRSSRPGNRQCTGSKVWAMLCVQGPAGGQGDWRRASTGRGWGWGVVEKEIPEVRRATSCRTYKPLHGLWPLLRNGGLGGSHWRAPHRRVMSLTCISGGSLAAVLIDRRAQGRGLALGPLSPG